MKDIYVHVGMPKTGTTFLQKRCFPRLKGVHFAAPKKNFGTPPTGIVELVWRVADKYPVFVDMEAERALADRFLGAAAEGKFLISSERLFGDMTLGFRDHFQVTESLRALFPDARIILTIRRQDEFLESLYRELLKAYFYPTVNGFLGYVDNKFEDWIRPHLAFPSVNVWRLDYHAYVQNYAAAFGRDNILVLPLEMLQDDPRRYHTELAAFMGVKPYPLPENTSLNPGLGIVPCRVALLLNRFVRAPRRDKRPWCVIPHEPLTPYLRHRAESDLSYRVLDALNQRLSLRAMIKTINRLPLPEGRFISIEKRKMIMDIHRESNRRIDEEYGLCLSKYGYY